MQLTFFQTNYFARNYSVTVYTVFINGGRAERPGFECLKARLGRPRTDHKTKQKIWRLLEELLMKMRV